MDGKTKATSLFPEAGKGKITVSLYLDIVIKQTDEESLPTFSRIDQKCLRGMEQ